MVNDKATYSFLKNMKRTIPSYLHHFREVGVSRKQTDCQTKRIKIEVMRNLNPALQLNANFWLLKISRLTDAMLQGPATIKDEELRLDLARMEK
jgi:hypothetical protein